MRIKNLAAKLEKVVKSIRNGDIVVYPTDTVFGIGCSIFCEASIQKIFELKKRPSSPLPILVGRLKDAKKLGKFNKYAKKLVENFWPGPLTLVVKARKKLSPFLVKNGKIGIRLPMHEVPIILAREVGGIVGTSANLHKKPPALTLKQAAKYFSYKQVKWWVEGECFYKKPSSVVEVFGKKLKVLREGVIRQKQIFECLGEI